MQVKVTTFGGTNEVLANSHYVAIPIVLDFSNVATTENGLKVVKAGTPLKSASNGYVVSNDGNATCILLTNVYETDPNGAGIVHGFINKAKAQTASGLTYSGSIDIKQVTIL